MVPTLGQLRERQCWVWLNCNRSSCMHYVPVALTPIIILLGEDASSDRLRHSARCSKCGSKGATIQLPSWASEGVGYQPFPADASKMISADSPPSMPGCLPVSA